MSKSSRRVRAAIFGGTMAALCVSASVPAMAGAFGLREQSSVGQGMSFAGMAAGGGESLSGMFWNPAVLNQVEHFQTEQHATAIFPDSKIKTEGGTSPAFGTRDSGNIGKNALLAAGYNAYRLTDQIAIGLSVNTPFGLATEPRRNFAGETLGRSSEALSFNAAPTIGYKFNDSFSIAAGLQIQYFDIELKQALPLPVAPGARPISTLDGDDIGIGYTLGATFAPTDWTSVGIGFRSKIEHKLKGDFRNGVPDAIFGPLGIPVDQNIKAKATLPELVTVGVRQKVSEDLTVLGGFEWTNWSRLGKVQVPAIGRTLSFDYEDGYFVSGGVEYAYSPDITVRGGVGYEWSPISNKNRDVRIPDDNRWWLSAGGSYDYSERLSFDLGYSYVFVPGKSKIDIEFGDGNYPFPVNAGPYVGSAKSDVHIISASVRYKIGAEAPAALVTKY